jgi:hypothetical protein
MPKHYLQKRLEDIKVPFEFRATMIRLYCELISKFVNNEDWSKEISFEIGVKQGFLLFPTLWILYRYVLGIFGTIKLLWTQWKIIIEKPNSLIPCLKNDNR